jgi:hypothetical protein
VLGAGKNQHLAPVAGADQMRQQLALALTVDRVTSCEAPPGRPLVELDLVHRGEDELDAKLTFSHLGALNLSNATANAPGLPEEGTWSVGETLTLGCPGEELVLRYDGRRAYRGPAPC